jgi:hypothetical protein
MRRLSVQDYYVAGLLRDRSTNGKRDVDDTIVFAKQLKYLLNQFAFHILR